MTIRPNIPVTAYYAITNGDTGAIPMLRSSRCSIPFIVSASAGTFTVEAAVYDPAAGVEQSDLGYVYDKRIGAGGGAAVVVKLMADPSAVPILPNRRDSL
jgi:hypothetical protein